MTDCSKGSSLLYYIINSGLKRFYDTGLRSILESLAVMSISKSILEGATTLSIMTLSITTFSIMTLSIRGYL